MPCNSDYLEATLDETVLGQLYLVYDEVMRRVPITKKKWQDAGYDKRVYGRVSATSKKKRDEMVRELCTVLGELPKRLTDSSLEVQMWYRDHKEADRDRERAEAEVKRRVSLRQRGLAKLTADERAALGLG